MNIYNKYRRPEYSIYTLAHLIYIKTSLMLSNWRTAWSTGSWKVNADSFSIVRKLSRNPVCII